MRLTEVQTKTQPMGGWGLGQMEVEVCGGDGKVDRNESIWKILRQTIEN